MDILVINLDRSTDRLREFERINPHLKHAVRFPAVDGKTITHADLLNRKIFEEPIFYTDGAIGNALSHLNAWNEATKNETYTTVLEDDAIVHKDFETLAPPLIATLPADWDIVLWGWNFDTVMSYDVFADTPCVARFSQKELRNNWNLIQKATIRSSLHRLHYAFGSVGYSVSSQGAKKLASRTLPIKPFLYKIPSLDLEIQNDAMDCVMASLYRGLNAYACFPPLALTKNDRRSSTVQQSEATGDTESELGLVPTDYTSTRKFRRKYARYLRKNGDTMGAARMFLRYLCSRKSAGSRPRA